MSEEYVAKYPFVPPYSNKFMIFGLLLQKLGCQNFAQNLPAQIRLRKKIDI